MLKPGYKTTEFLATIAVNVATLAAALQGSLQPKWAAIAGAVSVAGYAVARGLAKVPTPVVTPTSAPATSATPGTPSA